MNVFQETLLTVFLEIVYICIDEKYPCNLKNCTLDNIINFGMTHSHFVDTMINIDLGCADEIVQCRTCFIAYETIRAYFQQSFDDIDLK